MKIYQVIMQDEYNNLCLLGFYKNLKDSIKDINDFIDVYDIEPLKEEDLKEYSSTFSMVFDKELWDKDEITCIMVRGFILETDNIEVYNEKTN